nr:protein-methionine-sulfoxide reductase heme-binding subunit MsrQ [Kordiimonas sediminis]
MIFLLSLVPALWLVYHWYLAYGGLPHDLGFNPNETSNRFTGDWAIRFLLLSLAVTPFATVLRSPKPLLFRRMLGLYALFYAGLHVLSYIWLDMAFDWPELWADVLKRTYITVGMLAILFLLPLGVTSTKGWIKRMGAKRWQKLHKLVYLIGLLACVHFIMMRKGFQVEPLIYAGIFAALMLARLRKRRGKVRA